MKRHFISSLLSLVLAFSSSAVFAAGEAGAPATQSAHASGDAQRLTFLGDQLSADEAAIAAINKALIRAGYNAAVANDKAAAAAKGNELMDRNGGAPANWKDFYGRTARSFIMHDPYGEYYQIQRPGQMDYIYRANDNQISAAKQEVAALGQKTDALLKRRRELEAEQSSLWATLSFEAIANRDIPLRSLYRDQLMVIPSKDDDNRPDAARLAAMGTATWYMRSLAQTVSTVLEGLDGDQGSAYATLQATLNKAQDRLADAEATFADTSGTDPTEVTQMKDVLSQAKRIGALCKDTCEAYRKAQEADAAGEGEEQRKLLFRGTLQESLLSMPEAVAQADDSLVRMSSAWRVRGKPGTIAADKPLDVITVKQAALVAATPTDVAGTAYAEPSPRPEAIPSTPPRQNRVDLMQMIDVERDGRQGAWNLNDGGLAVNSPNAYATIEFPYSPPSEYDYEITFTTSRQDNRTRLIAVCATAGRQFAFSINRTTFGFGRINGKNSDNNSSTVQTPHSLITNNERCTLIVKVRSTTLEARLNGELICSIKADYNAMDLPPLILDHLQRRDSLALVVADQSIAVSSAEVTEVSGKGMAH